ncbi:MAG: MBL fold metallo-hydrolase [Candidatus Hodarchaeota archaeon]
MILRFWGTRGSIPSPGPDTVKYGGNTTCVELRLNDGTVIVFDAGTGIRNLGLEIVKKRQDHQINLFLSHSHWDHIQGFPFFTPAYQSNTKINIFGCPPTYDKLREILTNQMESRYFPINFDELKAQISFKAIKRGQYPIGNATFSFIENNHPGSAYGFKVIENNRHIVFITDNELLPPNSKVTRWENFISFCKEAEVLIHDAQYLDKELQNNSGFGHSSYEQALKLGLSANVKHLVFFHHNPSRKDDEIDKIVSEIQNDLKTTNSNLIVSAAKEGQIINV